MGRDSALYEIAQWFPRMAVYDDVRGWNTDPYLGQGEFYLEYGDIDYSVTVPAGYVVAGSGVLQNRGEVLTPAQVERLDRASQIVESSCRSSPPTRRPRRRHRVVRRHARRGASAPSACATSRGPPRRTSAGTRRAGMAFSRRRIYQFPKAGRAWESAAEQTQWSIRTYSELWMRYPYPQATSVAGPVAGMEYPMFVMVGYGTDESGVDLRHASITSRATSGSR